METIEIPVDRISIPEWNLRNEATDKTIDLLAGSIRTGGLINPILVREHEGGYQIIAGTRRYRAVKMLGYKTITARVMGVDEHDARIISYHENTCRVPLTKEELENSMHHLCTDYGRSSQEVSESLGIPKSRIDELLKAYDLRMSLME